MVRLPARASIVVLLVGFGLFLVAWAGANPPGAAPDEAAHLTKAIGTATGQGTGRATAPAPAGASLHDRFLAGSTRSFALPKDIRPDPRWACESFTTHSAACLRRPLPPASTVATGRTTSIVGLYPEPVYLPIGLAARLTSSPDAALYAGRAAGALICLLLLGVAAFTLADGWLLVGLLAVTSPMVLFLGGSVTTGGVEICAGIAHAAIVLALTLRSPDRRLWPAYAVSGVALAVTRPFGPAWVLADAALAAGLLGRSGLRKAVTGGGRAAIGSLTIVGLAAAATIAWDVVAMPTVAPSLSDVVHQVGPALSQSYRSIPQLFGVFGWLDTKPPALASDVAVAIYALIAAAGLVVGTRRQRLVLVLALAATTAAAVLVDAVTQRPFGFGLQARYVMPLTATTLLLAAWIVQGGVGYGTLRRRRLAAVVAPRVVSAVLVADLGVAWLANSRQAAGGAQGPRLFFRDPQWAPPGGWLRWVAVAGLAELFLLAAAWWPRSVGTPDRVASEP